MSVLGHTSGLDDERKFHSPNAIVVCVGIPEVIADRSLKGKPFRQKKKKKKKKQRKE